MADSEESRRSDEDDLRELDEIEIVDEPQPDPTPDPQTTKELTDVEAQRKRLEVRDLEVYVVQRRKYADRIFILICVWLAVVLVILLLDSFSVCGFKAQRSVLVALIGGTTASVISLFAIVANYLFPKKPQ